MALLQLSSVCSDVEGCPAVYVQDDEQTRPAAEQTVIVRGWKLDADTRAELPLPPGEDVVRLPVAELLAAADAIRSREVNT